MIEKGGFENQYNEFKTAARGKLYLKNVLSPQSENSSLNNSATEDFKICKKATLRVTHT